MFSIRASEIRQTTAIGFVYFYAPGLFEIGLFSCAETESGIFLFLTLNCTGHDRHGWWSCQTLLL